MRDRDEDFVNMQTALATGCSGYTSEKTWSKKPRSEDVPCASGEDPLEQPTCALDWGGEKKGKEHGSGPCPRPLQEDDVQGATLGS
jgi:hypothetical protein